MKRIKLTGIDKNNKPAKLGKDVVVFTSGYYIQVKYIDTKTIEFITYRGRYKLTKHATMNYYQGEHNGHKMQISLKKIVGEIRYW